MLRVRTAFLGVLVLLAGCTNLNPSGGQPPGEDCLLGGPPRDPPANREAFNLTSSHLSTHPPLADIFSSEGHSVELPCQDGQRLLEHLASEGADIRFSDQGYKHDVYLRHNQTTVFAVLRLVN